MSTLKQLFEYPHREVYVRINQLQGNMSVLQGKATDGSISLDGSSGLRRTCNLSFTLDPSAFKLNQQGWVLNTRFELEVGLYDFVGVQLTTVNTEPIYKEGPIVWFKQGHYLITSFNASLGLDSVSVSISGQDKMCLLNGEVSGTIGAASVDFGKYEEDVNGKMEVKYLTIKEIIYNILIQYAKEEPGNIIINDLDEEIGWKQIDYLGESALYILREGSGEYKPINLTYFGQQTSDDGIRLDSLSKYWRAPNQISNTGVQTGNAFVLNGTNYQVEKVETGEPAGYEATDLTFAGDLTASAGEAVTVILDKIRDMLGLYEYFYDVLGRFTFQKKKNWVQASWDNKSSTIEVESSEEVAYTFEDLRLFTSFANTPDMKNLKNDFTVWGARKSVTGQDLPIHMRLAIDKKPESYYSPWQNKTYLTSEYDWRELIYQMAIDYYRHNQELDFYDKMAQVDGSDKAAGRSGYEQYFQDLQGFWRQIYNPEASQEKNYIQVSSKNNPEYKEKGWTQVSGEEVTNYPRSSWYVKIDGSYYRWIDTINLIGEAPTVDILNLYVRKDGEYTPVSSIIEPGIYYNNEGKLLSETASEDERVRMYYKNLITDESVAVSNLVNINIFKTWEEFDKDRAGRELWISEDNGHSYWPINGLRKSGDDGGTSNEIVWDAYNSRQRLEYKTVNDAWKHFDKSKMVLGVRVLRLGREEELNSVLMINQDGVKQLYAAAKGYTIKDLFVKVEDDSLKNLLELQNINRDNLYARKETELEDGYILHEYVSPFDIVATPNSVYIYSEEKVAAGTNPPESETYYKTGLDGVPKTDGIAYKRRLKYYNSLNDYQPNYWHKSVVEAPETLSFWFDFIEPDVNPSLAPYAVAAIGQRPMAKNESAVRAIYYPDIPPAKFGEIFQIPDLLRSNFVTSSKGQSAYDAISSWLTNYTYITESVTVNSMPIYNLDVNTKIHVTNEDRGVDADYLVNKVTIPLSYSGTMTINAIKAPGQ